MSNTPKPSTWRRVFPEYMSGRVFWRARRKGRRMEVHEHREMGRTEGRHYFRINSSDGTAKNSLWWGADFEDAGTAMRAAEAYVDAVRSTAAATGEVRGDA